LNRNDEYGLQVKFPAKIKVCGALSGDHPVGFYVWLDRPTNCGIPKPPLVSSISITAGYNSSFKESPDAGLCGNGEMPSGLQVDMRRLSFSNLSSVRCVTKLSDGLIGIIVAAQGGRWGGSALPPEMKTTRAINYNAFLRTRPERLREDLATFRGILANTSVSPLIVDN
jgi:hypothetical protein